MTRTRRMLINTVFAVALFLGIGIVGLASVSWFAKKPESLGVTEQGTLHPCGGKPNCVCTFEERASHSIDPLSSIDGAEQAVLRIIQDVIEAMPDAKLVDMRQDYLHFEFRSRMFRFVDDVEILWNRQTGTVHFRSASRSGHSDLGVNRKRVERIKRSLQAELRKLE